MTPSKTSHFHESYFHWASFQRLDQVLSTYFQERFSHRPTILSNRHDLTFPKQKLIELVLYSDGADVLQHIQFLPKDLNYRVWVLSQYSASLLRKQFAFRRSQVGVIRRSDLFPSLRKKRDFPNFEKNGLPKFVYAGRIDQPNKNFALACALVSGLQATFKKPFEFAVCGPLMDEEAARIEVARHAWLGSPTIHGDLGLNWVRHFRDHTLINLSVFPGEDFSVVAAEAVQQGLPLILSDAGVFKELATKDDRLISVSALKRSARQESPRLVAQAMVDALMKSKIKLAKPITYHTPEVLSGMSLRRLIK